MAGISFGIVVCGYDIIDIFSFLVSQTTQPLFYCVILDDEELFEFNWSFKRLVACCVGNLFGRWTCACHFCIELLACC